MKFSQYLLPSNQSMNSPADHVTGSPLLYKNTSKTNPEKLDPKKSRLTRLILMMTSILVKTRAILAGIFGKLITQRLGRKLDTLGRAQRRGIYFSLYSTAGMIILTVLSYIDTYTYPYPPSYKNVLEAYRIFMSLSCSGGVILYALFMLGYVHMARMMVLLLSLLILIQYYLFVGQQTDMDLMFMLVIIILPAAIFSRTEMLEMIVGWVAGAVTLFILYGIDLEFVPMVTMDINTLIAARSGTVGFAMVLSFFVVLLQLRAEFYMDNFALETDRSQSLLLNILPASIAQELITNERNISHFHPDVSVAFSDLVGFTSYCHRVSAQELVNLLNVIVGAFDRISTLTGVEKIKTLGDGYMVACGIPKPLHRHAERAALMGLLCIKYVSLSPLCRANNIKLRVGINSGQVTAGVIGDHKFVYDIWGDTVNTASRMESNSQPMRLTCSESTLALTKNTFVFTKREPIDVRGKGSMNTWFIDGILGDTDDTLLTTMIHLLFGDIAKIEENRNLLVPIEQSLKLSDESIDQLFLDKTPPQQMIEFASINVLQ